MKALIFLPILIMVFSACNNHPKDHNQSTLENKPIEMEDFETFNAKFHSDSTFQLSRIAFPLEGQGIDGFEKTKWEPANWQLMVTPVGAPIDTSMFHRSIESNDSTVTEEIWVEASGFRVKRTFALKNEKWLLTSYFETNL